jgi:uncharacterized protein with FMN-binding domain
MRRAPIVLTATVAGVAGVLSFKPHEPSLGVLTASTASASPDTATATTAAGSSGGSGSSGSSGSDSTSGPGSTSGSDASSGSSSSGSSSSSSGSGDETSSSSSSSALSGTATGDSIATQYGPVQIRATVKNGKITKVEAIALTGNDPKSAQISASAWPYLQQSTLSKQTAAVDAVSGATVTTAGYEASLQSALDKIGFKAADGSRGTSTVPTVEEHGGPDGGFH